MYKNKIYGFGFYDNRHPIEIKATTEKKALIKFVEKHYKDIKEDKIILFGELIIK